jgi:hypothetical protein
VKGLVAQWKGFFGTVTGTWQTDHGYEYQPAHDCPNFSPTLKHSDSQPTQIEATEKFSLLL